MTQTDELENMLAEDRIKRWREEDSGEETEGFTELLCDAEDELRRLRHVTQAQIEKAAEAIYRHNGGVCPGEFEAVMGSPQREWRIDAPWDTHPESELCEHERDEYRVMACAALDTLGLRYEEKPELK